MEDGLTLRRWSKWSLSRPLMIAFEGFDIMRDRLELDSQNTQTRMQFNETQEFYDSEWEKEPRKIVPLI